MIDPPVDLIDEYRSGNASVLPYPTAGEYGEEPAHSYHSEPGSEPTIFLVFQQTITPGSQWTKTIDDRPEYWVVSMRDVANAIAYIWPYDAPSGAPIEIGPTGHCKLPGITDSITISAVGAANCMVNVMAVRGYDMADVTW